MIGWVFNKDRDRNEKGAAGLAIQIVQSTWYKPFHLRDHD